MTYVISDAVCSQCMFAYNNLIHTFEHFQIAKPFFYQWSTHEITWTVFGLLIRSQSTFYPINTDIGSILTVTITNTTRYGRRLFTWDGGLRTSWTFPSFVTPGKINTMKCQLEWHRVQKPLNLLTFRMLVFRRSERKILAVMCLRYVLTIYLLERKEGRKEGRKGMSSERI